MTSTEHAAPAGAQPSQAHRLSLIIPMYNEELNVAPMAARVHEALRGYAHPWELILVNDGSADATEREMHKAQQHYGGHVRVVTLQRNFGQTAAMQAGIDAARGDVIAMLDGDLQNDPIDIPRMVNRLLEEDLDLVAGWRRNRQDGLWLRKIPSRIANRLIRRITQVHLHDYGCSLKVFRADVLKTVRLYGEMHRFIPAWLAVSTSPSRIKEEVVHHHARKFGESKYGISRTFRVILDLLSVYFFMRYKSRPGHFFGKIGFIFGALGGVILSYLLFLKIFFGESIGTRPLLMAGVLFVVVAVQFFTTGVLSELIARTYFESSNTRSYVVRNAGAVAGATEADWMRVT
ncbi:MAG: glycosyltransferase family 2 protein [Pseudomonadota bacterium]